MPRQNRPAFEVAVTASPLFKLAPEIRIMIYELLLIQEKGMFITSDTFARNGRKDPRPHECLICGLVLLSEEGCLQHLARFHRSPEFRIKQILRPLLPKVSISLLQTCRLIRHEASPILYSRNSFQFSDASTASNFRWTTDCAQAVAIQEIVIKFCFNPFKFGFKSSSTWVTPWVTYIAKQTFSLGQDFPHLRRMTVDLNNWVSFENAILLRSMSERHRERSRGLDWVLVMHLCDEEVLDCFEPLVDKKDDYKNAKKEVRKHVWAAGTSRLGNLKHSLLWWGAPGGPLPHKDRELGYQSRIKYQSTLPRDFQESRHITV